MAKGSKASGVFRNPVLPVEIFCMIIEQACLKILSGRSYIDITKPRLLRLSLISKAASQTVAPFLNHTIELPGIENIERFTELLPDELCNDGQREYKAACVRTLVLSRPDALKPQSNRLRVILPDEFDPFLFELLFIACTNITSIELHAHIAPQLWQAMLYGLHRKRHSKIFPISSLTLTGSNHNDVEDYAAELIARLGPELRCLNLNDLSESIHPEALLGSLRLNSLFSHNMSELGSKGLTTLTLRGATAISRSFLLNLSSSCPRLESLEIGSEVYYDQAEPALDYGQLLGSLNPLTMKSLLLLPQKQSIFVGSIALSSPALCNLKHLMIASDGFPRSLFKHPFIRKLQKLRIYLPTNPDAFCTLALRSLSFDSEKALQIVGQVVEDLEGIGFTDDQTALSHRVKESILFKRIFEVAYQRAGLTPQLVFSYGFQ